MNIKIIFRYYFWCLRVQCKICVLKQNPLSFCFIQCHLRGLQGETKILKLKNLRPQDYANYTCTASVRNVCGIPDKSVLFRLTNKTGESDTNASSLCTALSVILVFFCYVWAVQRVRNYMRAAPQKQLSKGSALRLLSPQVLCGLIISKLWVLHVLLSMLRLLHLEACCYFSPPSSVNGWRNRPGLMFSPLALQLIQSMAKPYS